MLTDTPETPESVTLVPIDRIEVLNSRDRNMKVFEEIVENIRTIGLKKPITVAERTGEDGEQKYMLVCGEGRMNAFRILGETHIPALVIHVSDEDAFIMSLAENIARHGYPRLLKGRWQKPLQWDGGTRMARVSLVARDRASPRVLQPCAPVMQPVLKTAHGANGWPTVAFLEGTGAVHSSISQPVRPIGMQA